MARRVGVLGAYEQYQQRRGLMPSTIYCRRLALERATEWLSPTPLEQATAAQLEAWLDSLSLASRSRSWKISTLACFFAFAVREGYAADNPTSRIDRPRLRRQVPRPINRDDLRLAFAHATPLLTAWLALAALEGLRCQEIAGLAGEDVCRALDPPMLVVTRAKGLRERILPLHPLVESSLLAHGLPTVGPVFRRVTGDPYTPCRVSQILNNHLHDLGITATAHQLRHHFASALYRDTRDLRLVQELLGHADVATTAGYCAWSPAHAAVAVRNLTL